MEPARRRAGSRLARGRALTAAGDPSPRARLAVKVVPGASREGLSEWLGGILKVRVAAPPERGRANEAVRDLLAGALGVPTHRVRLVAGHAATRKVFEIEGIDGTELRRRIDAALSPEA